MSFYERYAKCCKEKGIQPASQATAEQIGCTRSNITALSKSGSTPRGDIVAGAAKMLNVSADYLLGLVDVPKPIENSFSENEVRVMRLLCELNANGQEAAEAVIRVLADQDIFKP